ncbi:unnamed protein product, partial [Iphiclides podalirius]
MLFHYSLSNEKRNDENLNQQSNQDGRNHVTPIIILPVIIKAYRYPQLPKMVATQNTGRLPVPELSSRPNDVTRNKWKLYEF